MPRPKKIITRVHSTNLFDSDYLHGPFHRLVGQSVALILVYRNFLLLFGERSV